jgi:hypothetical protein
MQGILSTMLLDRLIEMDNLIIIKSFVSMLFTALRTFKQNFYLAISQFIADGHHDAMTAGLPISRNISIYMQGDEAIRTVISACSLRFGNLPMTVDTGE